MQRTTFRSQDDGNLTGEQRWALRELRDLTSVIVKPSDKGGNIVLMERLHYERMCTNILKNVNWYHVIPPSFLDDLSMRYHTIVNKAYNNWVISEEIWDFLRVPNPKLATFLCVTQDAQKFIGSTWMPHCLR